MTTKDKIARRNLSLLELASEMNNVSKACRIMGYSRQQFYEIRRNYQTYGADGLIDRLPGARGPHPNRVSEEVEATIMAHALDHHAGSLYLRRPRQVGQYILVSQGNSATASANRRESGAGADGEDATMIYIASHATAFVLEHLPRDRRLSPHTIDSYSDSRMPGLGVRVRPSGGRSYVLLQEAGGRSMRVSLGPVPGPFTGTRPLHRCRLDGASSQMYKR